MVWMGPRSVRLITCRFALELSFYGRKGFRFARKIRAVMHVDRRALLNETPRVLLSKMACAIRI